MVSIPIGTKIPGSDKATIDIAAILSAISPTCTFGHKPMFVVVIATPTNSALPLFVPVAGATIETRQRVLGVEKEKKTGYANLNGIYWICIPVPFLSWSEFRVKQYNVNFGNGMAQFSNWRLVSEVSVFEGKIEIPCPVVSPLIGVSGFDKLTSLPKISTQKLNIPFSGYGTTPMSGDFEIKINGNSIKTGKVINGKVDFTFDGNLSDLLTKLYVPPALPPSSATIELIIKMGNCTFKNSTAVNIPKPIPPPSLPCTGSFVPPDITSLLSGITTPPLSLFIPVGLTGDKTSVPVDIFVGGTKVASEPTGFTGFNLIKMIENYYGSGTPRFDLHHTITIKSTATDCKIPNLIIPIPALAEVTICTPPQIPNPITGKCETPSIPGCDKLITTVDEGYPSHPKEITDFLAPFYVYIRGVREVCESDPTNPKFISKLPKGTPGTITLGSLSSNFYLTDDGIIDIDLSKLINLPSLAGVTGEVTPSPVPEPKPEPEPEPIIPGERIGSYCTLTPMKTTFAMAFFDVVHDTLGKIYSGNTYDQAKYKAQQDSRCFPTPTVAPCVTITITHRKWSDPRNAVIGFYSSKVGSRFAEGDQAWGWGGNPKPTDAEYLQTVAIPRTLNYLGGKFKSLYGRDMLKTDICGQK